MLMRCRITRAREGAAPNQVFYDENGHIIQLEKSEGEELEFYDIESIEEFFETPQLSLSNEQRATAAVQKNVCTLQDSARYEGSQYSCNVNYGDQ
ncbi:unnamed protein product [Gongylonema pulchrum]|uniref:Ig-like domain-containing protein n=1 Tax=Gongylonema pulchrum TaxID=637853 RepID=A0A183DUD5_9BILA|nr:unnamed protein product [Gongylonema pulchrum]